MAAPGDVLANRYELLSRAGRGGMAEVFRAHDRRLDRVVAVKVLAPHLLADARSLDRFDREARTAASLNHPNIVNVYDAVSDGDVHAIVMEFVEGPTLADIIEDERRLPIDRSVHIAISIADALQAAHDRGLVHHDVKPRNVLFDRDGLLKVADFGIARAASTDITTVQGSPPYLAPEQARGGRSDTRSDVYALGCVLYEMLAGRPPYEGNSSSSIVMAHIDAPIPEVSRYRPDVSRDLQAVVTRALAKDPDQRYESPAAFADDLRRLAEGLAPIGATIVSTAGGMPTDATRAYEDEWYDAPVERTGTYDAPPPSEQRRKRGGGARTLAITLAVLLLLVIGAMAWADSRGQQTAEFDPIASEAPAEPDPEVAEGNGNGNGSNNGNLLDRLNRRADRLQRLIERGQNADQETRDRLDEIRQQLDEALQSGGGEGEGQGGGNGGDSGEDVGSQLEQLQDRLNELAEDQETTQGIVDRLQELLNDLNPFNG